MGGVVGGASGEVDTEIGVVMGGAFIGICSEVQVEWMGDDVGGVEVGVVMGGAIVDMSSCLVE